ncbi:MAG: F0F1 ATP synthase subunit B [Anaerolineaceae bacterium]|nr:F0F1 ATP synthase subunit B [Anaerolineaceae bacterium]
MEGLGINLGYLIVQILNFIIIFLVLMVWVVKPVRGMLEKRSQTIAQGLEDARVANEARENAEEEAKKILTEAQTKAAEIIREAAQKAEKKVRDIQSDAEIDLQKEREDIFIEAEEERTRLLSELRSQVAALAIAAAQRLVGDALLNDKAKQHALLDEFFSGVKSGKVIVLEDSQITGSSAEVTSAISLTSKEQETVKKDILKSIDVGGVVSFKVDPSILGGLIVRVGDQVIDGSVIAQLEDMKQSLN